MAQSIGSERFVARGYVRDLARAYGGALLFSLPLLMTMEMWALGFSTDPGRLLAFVLLSIPLLYGLAHYAGFSAGRGLLSNTLDTLAALAVGFSTSLCLLALFNVLDGATPASLTGQLSLQTIPAAMGALIARRQLSDQPDDGDEDQASYHGELFLMTAGALYFALNLAPTEEMRLIAYLATPTRTLGILLLSIVLLHLIVFEIGFAGQEERDSPLTAFFHFTLPGYGLCLGVCLMMLWVFGGIDGHGLLSSLSNVVVLAFPAAIGAAAARLLV